MEDENIPRADKPFYNNVQRKAKATPYAIQLVGAKYGFDVQKCSIIWCYYDWWLRSPGIILSYV